MVMRSPLGSARVRSAQSGRSRSSAKNGPTVWLGVATNFAVIGLPLIPALERRRRAAAQHHVELIAERPFRFAQRRDIGGDQPGARRLIRGALVDRVVL